MLRGKPAKQIVSTNLVGASIHHDVGIVSTLYRTCNEAYYYTMKAKDISFKDILFPLTGKA